MDQVSLDRLAARSSAAGYSSIAEYAAALEKDLRREMRGRDAEFCAWQDALERVRVLEEELALLKGEEAT